jgi:hypothetical protein
MFGSVGWLVGLTNYEPLRGGRARELFDLAEIIVLYSCGGRDRVPSDWDEGGSEGALAWLDFCESGVELSGDIWAATEVAPERCERE